MTAKRLSRRPLTPLRLTGTQCSPLMEIISSSSSRNGIALEMDESTPLGECQCHRDRACSLTRDGMMRDDISDSTTQNKKGFLL